MARAVPHDDGETAAVLINATLKGTFAPVALPAREFMENARKIWERLGLPPLKPEPPWHGYDLGHWPEELARQARLAVESDYFSLGRDHEQRTPQRCGYERASKARVASAAPDRLNAANARPTVLHIFASASPKRRPGRHVANIAERRQARLVAELLDRMTPTPRARSGNDRPSSRPCW